MRTYIFTPYERQLIRRMLSGERDDPIWKLIHRIRKFDTLRNDVSLYMKASETVFAEE